MNVTHVTAEEICRGIPLKGFEAVKAALTLHASGNIPSSLTAGRSVINAIDKEHGDAAAIYAHCVSTIHGNSSQFLLQLIREAEERLSQSHHWEGSYQYDAYGTPFFKTNVEIQLADSNEEMYVLKLFAAHVGDAPEIELAKRIGVNRSLMRSTVTVSVQPINDTECAFDFDFVCGVLSQCFDLGQIGTEHIMEHMMEGGYLDSFRIEHTFRHEEPFYFKNKSFHVGMTMHGVKPRFLRVDGEGWSDTWRQDGSTLIMRRKERSKFDTHDVIPQIRFTLGTHYPSGLKMLFPIYDSSVRNQIASVTNKISDGFRSVIGKQEEESATN